MNKNQIKIFDTTLRDGQQCPGAGMSFEDNIAYAHLASGLGVDILEAGFPSASKLDFKIVNTIAKELAPKSDMLIAGLCQLREEQVDKTIEALSPAISHKKAKVHTYLPVDPELLRASLGEKAKDKNQLTKLVYKLIKKAVDAGCEVEFSPEGYSKMGENFDWVTELISVAIEAGANTINCPDTIGGAHRFEGEEYFVEKIKKHALIIEKKFPDNGVIWSCHCHNDFGTAVENSINAVYDGPVRQIECTINGLGERAGNASMEQCVMLIRHFGKYKNPDLFSNIKTEKFQEISDFVSKKMLPRQPHFPISGDNASCHTSGGHTNAILKNPLAYQPFEPQEVGKETSFVFGPLSGGNHAKDVIRKNGYICDDNEKAEIAQFIKDYYKERRKGITDVELMGAYFLFRSPIQVEGIDYSREADESRISLRGRFFDEETETHEIYKGKDSSLAALKKAIDKKMDGLIIQSYKSESEGETVHAQGIATILLSDAEGNIYKGKGEDGDIKIAAMKALIDSVNKVYIEKKFKA